MTPYYAATPLDAATPRVSPGRCHVRLVMPSRAPSRHPAGRWRQATLPASAPSAGMSSARPNFFSSDSMGWKPTTPRGWSPGLK